ncbi:MAG: anthrone oxygenase family protein [Actinomycetota bacterium]|nr:anthrone oxygenase family protein [Actinomycetota bacterium]
MTDTVLTALACAAAAASAAAGGMMFPFSAFVLRGLDRTGSAQAIGTMRAINAEATVSAVFLVTYFGAGLLALAVGVLAAVQWPGAGGGWLVGGAVAGIAPAVVTVARNVPLNVRLDTAEVSEEVWQRYRRRWVVWNHVRTATALTASALFLVGLTRL